MQRAPSACSQRHRKGIKQDDQPPDFTVPENPSKRKVQGGSKGK